MDSVIVTTDEIKQKPFVVTKTVIYEARVYAINDQDAVEKAQYFTEKRTGIKAQEMIFDDKLKRVENEKI